MEILRLIAVGLSNQKIADTLVVSVNTVKTHVRRLYSKLSVNNRIQAVERARELDLL
jgi:LuxR family maltose regulon positive regulatory protein